MGKAGTFGGTLSLVIGVLLIIGWIGAGMVVDYIDNQLEENCNSTAGQIGQITGWDEGQCQDGRDTKDLVSSIQMPLLGFGAILVVFGGVLFFRS
ncbi:MAG: hypothetical protein ACJZ39_05805 [Candidatus Thalassarchaeaceae archaeon]